MAGALRSTVGLARPIIVDDGPAAFGSFAPKPHLFVLTAVPVRAQVGAFIVMAPASLLSKRISHQSVHERRPFFGSRPVYDGPISFPVGMGTDATG